MADTLNLYQKLLKITEEVGKIEKTGKNSMQGYSFIEQAQVVAELRPQLAKWGVFIIPETVSRSIERFENKKGTITVHANVVSRYTVVNADKPDERFVSEWDGGEALDTSDKATNKATTASHKYYLMKLFNISDKDDADAETIETVAPVQTVKRRASQKQILMLAQKVQGAFKSYDREAVIGYIEASIGKLLTDLMSDEVDDALAKLDKAIRDDKILQTLEPEAAPKPDFEAGEGDIKTTNDDLEAFARGELPY